MSINRWVDKEDVLHMYNEILLSHKKELIWVICYEMNKPRACYTEWNKSERQTSCINAYMWNLENWYWWTYLQGRNGNTDIENVLVVTVGEREGGINWESSTDIYTVSCIKQTAVGSCHETQGAQPEALWWPSGWDGRRATRLKREGWYMYFLFIYIYCIYIIMTDLHSCTVETNTTL